MCFICEGGTTEQYNQRLHEQILRRGFALSPVGSGWKDQGFADTIGLIDGRDHPELVVVSVQLSLAVAVLDDLAGSVVEGRRFEAGGTGIVGGVEVGFRTVRAHHVRRGLMDGWFSYYREVGRYDLEVRALQVVLPDGGRCHECRTTQPHLDRDLHASVTGPGRQARRAHLQRPKHGRR
jgi:Domain of unknown function (DUF4262)